MPTLTLELPQLHTGQREVWNHPARFKVMACGRRWGKSRLGSLLCIAVASKGGRAWWVGPTYPVASVGWRMIRRIAAQIPGVDVRESERMVTLPTGGTVQVKSADNPDSLRGEGLNFVVIDECAFVKEDAWTDALRPALADRKGGALFISTPKGHNWFWRLWHGAEGDSWQAWKFSSYDNPFLDPAEIDAARSQLPERTFSQEFLAEFIDDAGGVFRRVPAAVADTWQDEAQDGAQYVFGVDWARSGDWTVITVVDITSGSVVHLDRFNQVEYSLQLRRLQALYDRFQPSTIIAEANSMGGPLVEALQRMDLPVQPFMTTNATKSSIVDALALAFERGDIRIPNDATLIAELQAFEMDKLPSGLIRYAAPEGLHDDCVMSLALAWAGVSTGQSLLLW